MYQLFRKARVTNNIFVKDPGQSYKEEYVGEWKKLIDKCTDALDRLMEIASSRRRNYILDQVCSLNYNAWQKCISLTFS